MREKRELRPVFSRTKDQPQGFLYSLPLQFLKGAMAFTLTSFLLFCLNNGASIFLKETEPKEDEETYFKDWLILSCKLGNTRFTRKAHMVVQVQRLSAGSILSVLEKLFPSSVQPRPPAD